MLPARSVSLCSGLSRLAASHDLLLCDIWGVIHNGVAVFSPAVEALQRFRQGGGHVILVSNAPRPASSVCTQLHGLGFPETACDAILTSGDMTRGMIAQRVGQALFHMGPERDLALFEGLGVPLVALERSDYVVCTGLLDDDTETAADYAPQLAAMARRGLTMVCANPDLAVDRGGRTIPCAGAIGLAYEQMGGDVVYPGKPYGPIYAHAMVMAAALKQAEQRASHVLAIGDSLRTDIAGASAFGVDSLLVLGGIHAHEAAHLGPDELQAWLDSQGASPQFAMPSLIW